MITDINLLLASAQTGFVATDFASTNVVDLKNIYDIGAGKPVYAVVTVTTTFAGGASVQFQVKASDNSTIDASDETVGSSAAIPSASLTAGSIFVIPVGESYIRDSRTLSTGVIVNGGRRYLGVWYDVTGTFSAGAVNVSIVLDPQSLPKNYDSGFKFVKTGSPAIDA